MTRINRLPILRSDLGAVRGTTTLISRTSLKMVRGFQFVFIVTSQAAARSRVACMASNSAKQAS
jgi:hypothetical protein